MATVVPSSVDMHIFGDLRVHIVKLPATADHTNTWASGIPGIVAVFASQSDASGTQSATGAGASYSGSTITVYLAEDNSAATLLIFSKS